LEVNEGQVEASKLPDCDKEYALESLFEVSMGLIPDRYHPRTRTNPDLVDFLRIGSFKLNDVEKDQLSLSKYESRNIVDLDKLVEQRAEDEQRALKRQRERDRLQMPEIRAAGAADESAEGEGDGKKSFIPEKKILTGDDYLFSIRGVPRGYSMNRSVSGQHRLVASHHFIQVRPLPGVDLHIPFVHLVFDFIVEKVLTAKYSSKKKSLDGKGSTSAVFNTVKVDEIRALKMRIPGDKNAQEQAYGLFIENYERYMEASLNYYVFKDEIMGTIVPG
jgi:hypothetical protein